MNYIIMGLLVSIGWHLVEIIFEIVRDLLFPRLYRARWFRIVAGKEPKNIEEKPGDIKAVKNKIGFY